MRNNPEVPLRPLRASHLLLIFFVTFTFTACAPVDTANSHLKSLDGTAREMKDEVKKSREALEVATEQSKRIADALVELKNLGVDLVTLLKATFVKKPTEPTDDIDAVLSEPFNPSAEERAN